MNTGTKLLSILIVIAIVIGLGWYFLSTRSPEENNGIQSAEVEEVETQDGIVVAQTNIAETGSKLPPGFPSNIPVEQINITESYRVAYTERGVTQYTVSYTSNKSRDDLWDEYNSFMKNAGFTVDTNATSRAQGQISGAKDDDTLSVIVSARSGVTLAQVNLLVRE